MASQPHFHPSGDGALLMGFGQGTFKLSIQERLWTLCTEEGALNRINGVREVVLGVNNVLVTFDPLEIELQQLRNSMEAAWAGSKPDERVGRLVKVPVIYDATSDFDLLQVAHNANLSVEEAIALHTSVDYRVACIGWVPGFAYLIGLPPKLFSPRKAVPRALVPKGAVGIGGEQTGIIPLAVPSGWNLLGVTDVELFDPHRDNPCLLAPGDHVRFTVKGTRA